MSTNLHDKMLAAIDAYFSASDGDERDQAEEQLLDVRDEINKRKRAEQTAQQEPVAVVSGYYGGQCVILPINPARIFNSNTALYTTPQPPAPPLTDERIEIGRRAPWGEALDPFTAGVRFAETHYGITKGNT